MILFVKYKLLGRVKTFTLVHVCVKTDNWKAARRQLHAHKLAIHRPIYKPSKDTSYVFTTTLGCNVHAYANPGLQRIILYCKTDLSICSNKYTRSSTIFNHACTIYTLP